MDTEEGYIYCISNLDIMPGIYKVGVTMRSPLDRLKEANSSDTWKIPYYKIEFAKKVNNPKDKEKTLHRLMEKFMSRVHPRREFFRGELSDIKEAFNLMDGTIWNEKPPVEIIDNHPISIEERLSEDPDIRVKQLIELIYLVFTDNVIKINKNGGGDISYFSIFIDKVLIFIIENHNIGSGKIAMITTPSQPREDHLKKHILKEYYSTLNWDPYGNFYLRKQYDTEGKTKQEVVNIFQGFKNILLSLESHTPSQGGTGQMAPLKVLNGGDNSNYSNYSNVIKKIIWSDEDGEITDKFNNTYSFGAPWRNNQYIKVINKNGSKFNVDGGVHRGYSIWLDDRDILHISHGHQNIKMINHCIFDDNTIKDNWLCNWGNKFKKDEIEIVHNHFGISNI